MGLGALRRCWVLGGQAGLGVPFPPECLYPLLYSPTRQLSSEDPELEAPRAPMSQQPPGCPEPPVDKELGRGLGDITRVQLRLGVSAPRPLQGQLGRLQGELLAVHQALEWAVRPPDLPLDLSVRRGPVKLPENAPHVLETAPAGCNVDAEVPGAARPAGPR